MSSTDNQDERIAKRADNGSTRGNRLTLDRPQTENRENNDAVRRAERRAMLSDVNTLLPNPPKIPNFHTFWATTTNNKDSVENRQRMGYSFVTRAEMPDFLLSSQKMGESTEDRIMVNEMVLMKIDEATWEDDMLYKHYDLPAESMKNLKDSVQIRRDGRGRQVAYTGGEFNNGVADGYGMTGLGKPSLNGVR